MTRTDGEAGAGAVARADQQGRILTVPNAISVARLAGVPVFLWLVLGPQADGWAVALLIVAGLSDWLDGVIARAWNQQSRLGQVLDPAADRLYIAATLIGLAIRGIIPWWLVALLQGTGARGGAAGAAPARVRPAAGEPGGQDRHPVPAVRVGSLVGPSRSGELPCTGGPPCCTWSRHAAWVRQPGASLGRDGGPRDAGHDPGPAAVK